VKLVGVGLTDTLGWGEKEQLVRTNQTCIVDRCSTAARHDAISRKGKAVMARGNGDEMRMNADLPPHGDALAAVGRPAIRQ
jgi:hypothetical protein